MSKRKANDYDASCQSDKRRKPVQKFRDEYTEKFPCIVKSSTSINHALCTVCNLHFKITHGGITDIQRHVKSVRHCEISRAATQSVSRYFSSASPAPGDLDVIHAETLFTHFLVEHNIPLSAADHCGKLFRQMFPKDKTAQQYACGRTKTTAIVKCLAKDVVTSMVGRLQKGPFVLGTDGSEDKGDKFFPIVVRYVGTDQQILTELLANPVCHDTATGEHIFELLEQTLNDYNVPWNNCLALVCDNANVMTGKNKGVISFIQKKVPDVHLAGCVCHLLSLTIKKATHALTAATGFAFDDILHQLSWYVNKSSNRLQRFQDQQKSCGVPQLKLVDHCQTRWLSLGLAIKRLLQQWEPLLAFFKGECSKKTPSKSSKEVEKDTVKARVAKFLGRRTTKLYALFLAFIIELFDKLNIEMQTDKAKIHVIKRSLEAFYRKVLSCYIKPSAFSSCSLLEVDFTAQYNIKSVDDIMIGTQARHHLSSPGVVKKVEDQFFKDVLSFYQEACTYLKSRVIRSGQPLWKHAEVADAAFQTEDNFGSIQYFVEKFPCLLPCEATLDEVQLQYLDFQTVELPDSASAEELWACLAKMKDVNGTLRFQLLSAVMLGILLIPVSNCACERVFSIVRKNRTDFRPSMGADTTEALMILKAKGAVCHQAQMSAALLKQCKHAMAASLARCNQV